MALPSEKTIDTAVHRIIKTSLESPKTFSLFLHDVSLTSMTVMVGTPSVVFKPFKEVQTEKVKFGLRALIASIALLKVAVRFEIRAT